MRASIDGLTGPRMELGRRLRRSRSLFSTASLAAVLVVLVMITVWGNSQTQRVAATQDRALTLEALFSDVRAAVAMEHLRLRSYQLEPSNAVRSRYVASADATAEALQRASAAVSGSPQAEADALRLRDEHVASRAAADRLIATVAEGIQTSSALDRLEVQPTYYTLQHDIDNVVLKYRSNAQRVVSELEHIQSRVLVTMVIGFTLGLGLVAVIWRVVLGYQRRLRAQVEASEHLALHDPLTELPNRALLKQRLGEELDRREDQQLALMIVDLNGFKSVNDTLGHPAGDELLIDVSRRLRALLCESETIARLGGDEFAVLIPAIASITVAIDTANKVDACLRREFTLAAGSAVVSGSVGLAIGCRSSSAETLLRHADAAMYQAKRNGAGPVVYDARPQPSDSLGDRPSEPERVVAREG